MSQTKILLLWERMGDYHRARWRALSNIVGHENCYGADLGRGDGLYHWANTVNSSNYICLSHNPVNATGIVEPFKTFRKFVKNNKITHVCIPGYGRAIYLILLLYCRLKGIRVLMFAESWYGGGYMTDKLKGMFINLTADVVFVSGKRAATHFNKRLGINERKIIEGYSVVDNSHFAASEVSKKVPSTLLCVARFAEEKNLELLIDAFQQSDLSKTWRLKIVGGGELKDKLQKCITSSNVELSGWLSYAELPDLYNASSLFILPSKFEPWGLVVNEAMAASIPIILSDAVGALPDLLVDGENGWCFVHDNRCELIGIFNHIASLDSQSLRAMGQRSKGIIEGYSCDTWAQKVYMERCRNRGNRGNRSSGNRSRGNRSRGNSKRWEIWRRSRF